MAKALPDLSKAEWFVMKLGWKRREFTARQIFDEATQKRAWAYQTVKTMLDRLAIKGYLHRRKLGPLCLFKTAVPQSKAVAKAISGFADTVLDNTLGPLVAHLARGKRLSDEELSRLKALVRKQEETEGDGDA